MKISRVKIYQLRWPQLTPIWHPVVVQVSTDTGISGYGEAGIAYGVGSLGTVGVLQELGARIIGRDPLAIKQIWQDFYEHTFWAKSGGSIFYSAVSALDIALWDLKGRFLHQPLYQLLGGKIHGQLPAYASHLEYGWGPFSRCLTSPRDFARLAKRAVNQGFRAVKLDPLPQERGHRLLSSRGLLTAGQLHDCYERVAAVRNAVGDGVQIIIDCHADLRVGSAVQLARKLAPLGIYYFEEPCPSLDPADYQAIANQTPIPLAAGEHLTIAKTYAPFIRHRLIQVAQPDLGTCGGITGALAIAAMTQAADINLQLHVCGGPLATAAALQFEAACGNFLIHEEHEINLKTANWQSGRYRYQPVKGAFTVPDRPGIGQELSRKALAAAETTVVE